MRSGDSTEKPSAGRGRPGREPARPVLVTTAEEPTAVVPPVVAAVPEEQGLGREAGVGLAWSLANNVVGRLGNFLAGIVVVRLLSQEQYGVFAIGLTVLTVLLSLNELGVSVAIVQYRDRVEDIAPTVMTLAIASSATVAGAGFLCAPALAELMGAPDASGLIRLLIVGVVLDGVAAVPNAMLSRRFMQRRRLKIDTIAFVVGTPVTILLAMNGYGAWSLGWGAVVGNVTTALLALLWTPLRVRPGWNADVARQVLRFGMPLAGASLLALLVLNVDFIVVGHQLGPEELGLYLLAFNLCSWPITVVISAVRRVAVALFARLSEHSQDMAKDGFTRVIVIVLGIALPMCVLLGGFAVPLIATLYGSRWSPAAVALPMLAVLSFGRVAVEITYDYLAGSGRTRSTIWLHGMWFATLAPALILGARIALDSPGRLPNPRGPRRVPWHRLGTPASSRPPSGPRCCCHGGDRGCRA